MLAAKLKLVLLGDIDVGQPRFATEHRRGVPARHSISCAHA
jgi:hypothetical protein